MSFRQYGTLRYIMHYDVYMEHIRQFNMSTLGSIVKRGWVERKGTRVVVTKRGEEAYMRYNRAEVSKREHEADISPRVALMLHVRNLHVIGEPKAS